MSIEIDASAVIETNSIVGYNHLTHLRNGGGREVICTWIGKRVLIRPNSIIYAGCTLLDDVKIGSNVVMREFTMMGKRSYLGNNTVVEGYTEIGHDTAIHSNCHITAKAKIGNYCFIGPGVITGNARNITWPEPNPEAEQGPIVEDYVKVGLGACLLPGVHVGKYAVVAAGSVVVKDVAPHSMVMGVPAEVKRA